MLKMRLQRIGRKNNPSFRVIVTDSRNAPSRGRHVDLIGSYDPRQDRIEIDAEKAKHWIQNGAQVSDTVYNILVAKKIVEGRKKNVLPKKSPVIDEAKLKAEAEAKVATEAKVKADADVAKVAEEAVKAEAEEIASAPQAEVPAEVAPEIVAETPEVETEAVKA
jgi:small subunit ribosomal protein S16